MKSKIIKFLFFSVIIFSLGSLSVLSQSPWNIILILLLTFPIFSYVLNYVVSQKSFFSRLLNIILFGSIFLYGYFFFGLSWVSSAFHYKAELEGLRVLSIFGLPLLLTLASLPGWLFTAFFWAPGFQKYIAVALGIVVGEYVRGTLFTGFPWILFGHSLSFDDRAMQITSSIGAQGASFLIVLFALTPALLLRKKTFTYGLMTGLIMPCLMVYGFLKIPDELKFSKKDFLLVQPNISQDIKMNNNSLSSSVDKFINLSSGYPNVDLIIWPESALPILLEDSDQIRKHIMDSIEGDSNLLTGSIRIDDKGFFKNSALLIDDDGNINLTYDKLHLVPFGEYLPFSSFMNNFKFLEIVSSDNGFKKGQSSESIKTPIGLARLLICYEIIFSKEIILPNERPDMLINITNDAWFDNFSGPYQHFDNARFRAIEYGVPVLRSANTGISGVIGPYGRVLEKINLGEDGAIYSFVPEKIDKTFFSKFGDFTLLILFILCFLSFKKNLMREYFYGKK